jgi:hypothetical protein
LQQFISKEEVLGICIGVGTNARICMKEDCFKELNLKIKPSRKYNNEANLPIIDTIDLQNIFDNNKYVQT